MATTKCCSGGTCDSIVTIGYMREMAKKRLANGTETPCVSVSSATSFSSCCTADESAYTPTYGEITGGTYASVRSLDDSNPLNDVNGFSAYTQTPDTNCCEISLDEKVIPQSALTFGYTEIYAVTLTPIKTPKICELGYEIKKTNTFVRRTFGCVNDVITEISSSLTQVTLSNKITSDLTKEYGQIGGEDSEAISNVTVFGRTVTSDTIDSCYYVKSGSTTFAASSYTVSVTLNCETLILCDGGYITANVLSMCSNDVVINGVRLSTNEDGVTAEFDEDGNIKIWIPKNEQNFSETILFLDIQIGTNNKEIKCILNRESCEIGPSTQGYCGDLWNIQECWDDNNTIFEYNCDGSQHDCPNNNS